MHVYTERDKNTGIWASQLIVNIRTNVKRKEKKRNQKNIPPPEMSGIQLGNRTSQDRPPKIIEETDAYTREAENSVIEY